MIAFRDAPRFLVVWDLVEQFECVCPTHLHRPAYEEVTALYFPDKSCRVTVHEGMDGLVGLGMPHQEPGFGVHVTVRLLTPCVSLQHH